MYKEVEEIIQTYLAKFEKHRDVVDTDMEYLEEFGPPEDAWAS